MTILMTGLLAGVLDGIAATLLFLARGNKNPALLFRYIASAVYGKAAFGEGKRMVFLGVLFHLLIAGAFVAAYFGAYPYLPWLKSYPLAGAFVYGLLVWGIMNLLVVPFSGAAPRPFSPLFALINMLILVAAIGLPAAYFSHAFYR